jgi:hypothetical protein
MNATENSFEHIIRVTEAARRRQQEHAIPGPKSIAVFLPGVLVNLFEGADEDGKPVPVEMVHLLADLLVNCAFGSDSDLGRDALPTLVGMKVLGGMLAYSVLNSARAEGMGWGEACYRARVAVNAFAAGDFARIGRAA